MTHLNKLLLVAFLLCCASPMLCQETPDDLDFESDSTLKPYRPKGRNYVFIRSKRGQGGVKTTNSADSITSIPITEIVLVYTEMDASDRADRAKANYERWSNLMQTYPEFFQYSSTFVNLCQCNSQGDAEAFKRVQGFYIYYESDELAAMEPPAEPEPVAVSAGKEESKDATATKPKVQEAETKETQAEEPVAKNKARESSDAPGKAVEETAASSPEEPAAETPPAPPKPAGKPAAKKTAAAAKLRKAKDPKACRPACYGYGDEDLSVFFKDNLVLTKKQKKKGKNLMATVSLQLNPDGTIKKAMVTGPNPDFNKQVEAATQTMQPWRAAVRNGVTVKSQVKINLKFDKNSKTMIPADVLITPRPGPKCVCVSDEEIFGE